MKRNKGFTLLGAIVVLSVIAIALGAVILPALAGNVYDRSTTAMGPTTGTFAWTNTVKYSALELKRIWVEDALATNHVVTVSRKTSDGSYTQAVGTVTCGTASNGNTASFTAGYLKYGDVLTGSSTVTTGATVMVEYEVQQH